MRLPLVNEDGLFESCASNQDRLAGQDLAHAVDAWPIPGMGHESLLHRLSEDVTEAADLGRLLLADKDGPVAVTPSRNWDWWVRTVTSTTEPPAGTKRSGLMSFLRRETGLECHQFKCFRKYA
jgi:hypothetical protein